MLDTFALSAGSLEPEPGPTGEACTVNCSPETSPSGCTPARTAASHLGGVSGMVVIGVEGADDPDAYAQERGADLLKATVDQPRGVREFRARDREGHLWFFDPLD